MTAEINTAHDAANNTGSPVPASFDTIKRFIFNEKDIRGEIVQTCQAYRSLIADHAYPRNIRRLMGEMQAAITLMTETVKFQGSIMLQLRGNGDLVYAYINSNEKQETRGLASWNGDIDEFCHWTKLLGKDPILTITIIPEEGARYQGIIDLTHDHLNECIEDYYRSSVQIETRVWLYCDPDSEKAAGILLQKLPADNPEKLETDFNHIATLTDSMTEGEILSLECDDVLYRLFHQESVNTFPPKPVSMKCVCSREHFRESLVCLGAAALEDIIREQGSITVNCQSCGKTFTYDPEEAQAIIAEARKQEAEKAASK